MQQKISNDQHPSLLCRSVSDEEKKFWRKDAVRAFDDKKLV